MVPENAPAERQTWQLPNRNLRPASHPVNRRAAPGEEPPGRGNAMMAELAAVDKQPVPCAAGLAGMGGGRDGRLTINSRALDNRQFRAQGTWSSPDT